MKDNSKTTFIGDTKNQKHPAVQAAGHMAEHFLDPVLRSVVGTAQETFPFLTEGIIILHADDGTAPVVVITGVDNYDNVIKALQHATALLETQKVKS